MPLVVVLSHTMPVMQYEFLMMRGEEYLFTLPSPGQWDSSEGPQQDSIQAVQTSPGSSKFSGTLLSSLSQRENCKTEEAGGHLGG